MPTIFPGITFPNLCINTLTVHAAHTHARTHALAIIFALRCRHAYYKYNIEAKQKKKHIYYRAHIYAIARVCAHLTVVGWLAHTRTHTRTHTQVKPSGDNARRRSAMCERLRNRARLACSVAVVFSLVRCPHYWCSGINSIPSHRVRLSLSRCENHAALPSCRRRVLGGKIVSR